MREAGDHARQGPEPDSSRVDGGWECAEWEGAKEGRLSHQALVKQAETDLERASMSLNV